MWSILRPLLGTLALGALAACQMEQRTPRPEPLNPTAIPTDAAMQARRWSPSVANYKSDLVMAWPTYAPLCPKPLPRPGTTFVEPALAVGNTLYTPIDMIFVDHPWTAMDYKSLRVDPTYTAVPPLPPSPPPPVW